jgi:hypothetical protein
MITNVSVEIIASIFSVEQKMEAIPSDMITGRQNPELHNWNLYRHWEPQISERYVLVRH